jgi:hypothetical protein
MLTATAASTSPSAATIAFSCDIPDSVEAAGALLGAAITKCTISSLMTAPPRGMPAAFGHHAAVSSAELLQRLYELRSFLHSTKAPLLAAPSLLAVLMKLLAISNNSNNSNNPAAAASSQQQQQQHLRPLSSIPIRHVWADCVVRCHVLGAGLKGVAAVDTLQYARQMLVLAVMNPRAARSAGGARLAALIVVQGTLTHCSSVVGEVSVQVLQTICRALKSAGAGEPGYRVQAVQTATATVESLRRAAMARSGTKNPNALFNNASMDDRAVQECFKLLKLAVTDKFAEVRRAAACLAAALAPLLLGNDSTTSNSYAVDEVLQLAWRNLDDASAHVAHGWAWCVAKCISAIALQPNHKTATTTTRFKFATVISAQHCSTVKNAISYLTDQFVKAGGELMASRMGGTYSVGGRASRMGITLALTKLLRLQVSMSTSSHSVGEQQLSMKDTIELVLVMLGEDMEKQLQSLVTESGGGGGGANALFGGASRGRSKADPSLVRVMVNRVLRQGLSEVASEPMQLAMLHDIVAMVTNGLSSPTLNANQLEVLLVEISHLLSTLGEAAASVVEGTVACVKLALVYRDHGVRHEAAIVCAALAASFPSEGRKIVQSSLIDLQTQHAEILAKISNVESNETGPSGMFSAFRRGTSPKKSTTSPQGDLSMPHQYAIHGLSLMISILLKDLPKLSGGVPSALIASAMSVAESLVAFQSKENIAKENPGAVCMCVRAGFAIISGILATGPTCASIHMPTIFAAWQTSCDSAKTGEPHLAPRHDLFCMEAVLASTVCFLKYCPELLLTVPEALTKVSMLLENALELFLPGGRLKDIPTSDAVAARLESATAALLEAFAWLPSGTFPMAADNVFALAAHQIKVAIEADVSCSLLQSLINQEDSLLDAKTLSRAKRDGELGGARDLEETIVTLTGEAIGYGEREAVIHLISWGPPKLLDDGSKKRHGSSILGAFAFNQEISNPPTPLHEVGSWRRPREPFTSSKVRLVDAAIQSFAATFGLKSGKEQQDAMDMLESLVPPLITQLASTMGINAKPFEQDRRPKTKEESAAATNITAVLLACLQAIPLHEATHNLPLGLGPEWMNKGKDLLLTLLPSWSSFVRRGAAEGLALLASIGVSEEGRFLQSAILHSLDEVMQGNKPDGKPKAFALEPISAARSGSLLALACIQRASYNVAQRRESRSKQRVLSCDDSDELKQDEGLPFLQMMTRILPAVAYYGEHRDYFSVMTYALHSFTVLLSYSTERDGSDLYDTDKQLLRKGIELIEGNFTAAWTSSSADIDMGQEVEKLESEASFLAVLLRMMTFVVPFLDQLGPEKTTIALRFSIMATVILELRSNHPVVVVEAMGLFEVLALKLPPLSSCRIHEDKAVLSCIPFLTSSCYRLSLSVAEEKLVSSSSIRASTCAAKALALSTANLSTLTQMETVSLLMAMLETACGSRFFFGSSSIRSLAAPREYDIFASENLALEQELFQILMELLLFEHAYIGLNNSDHYLRWLLWARAILAGSTKPMTDSESEFSSKHSRAAVIHAANQRAASDAAVFGEIAGVPRWQVKTLAAQLACLALDFIADCARSQYVELEKSPNFNPDIADAMCKLRSREASEKSIPPVSFLVFHLEEILAAACVSSTATLDQAELRALQGSAVLLLGKIVTLFTPIRDPEQREMSILDQFSTQIFSAVKHPFSAPDESDSEESSLLFMTGCEVLQNAIRVGLTSDPTALVRLIRPAIPVAEDTQFFVCSKSDGVHTMKPFMTELMNRTVQSQMHTRVSKVWNVSMIFTKRHGDKIDRILEVVSAEILKDRTGLASHCAAVGIDGACLLLASKLSLAGKPLKSDDERVSLDLSSGFQFENFEDVNIVTKDLLVKGWSTCIRYALETLLFAAASDEGKQVACTVWVKALFPFLITGIHDAHEILSSEGTTELIAWKPELDVASIIVDCLRGLGTIVSKCPSGVFEMQWNDQMESVLEQVRTSTLMPALGILVHSGTGSSKSEAAKGDVVLDERVVDEVCGLLTKVAASTLDNLRKDSLLLIVLEPLGLLQAGEVDFQQKYSEKVVATCFGAIGKLIKNGDAQDTLVRAMIHLVLTTALATTEKSISQLMKKSSIELLRDCMGHISIKRSEQYGIAGVLARTENWEAWCAIATIGCGEAVAGSLTIVAGCLLDCSKPISQAHLLEELRQLTENAEISSPLMCFLLQSFGAEILEVFIMYGTLQIPDDAKPQRQAICADAMKISLIAYQQVSAGGSDENTSSFLSVLFQSLLAVLRFNGLPNHPSPTQGGDVTLGRICAQAILNVARTTPGAFKSTVAALGDHERQLLELAVRAEMSGYAMTSQAPVKKKLDLKSFKK